MGRKKRDSGFGLREFGTREGFKEVEGDSPSPLILSLGGARKIKETGYHRPQGEIAAHPLGARNDR